ncbi:acyltransferase family protein [Demequina salsinemoris]|uniref:acyltransferase family protein n=1 Tax=Demequina salsinemoris TaxID=577470 RepID=UPI0007807CF1|nr:acyltransferase family protein [Demequina salsinemoris]
MRSTQVVVADAPAPGAQQDASSRRTGFRPEIQGLRALAVTAVVAFHFWPGLLPGGYVGVDVFFVISGFLIGGHLLRDALRGQRNPVPFWARRVRRLMPASLLAIVVTGAAMVVVVPVSLWRQFSAELIASALYFENWALASQSVDYLAEGAASSPVEHFWSLSVEEQFYLVWPLLVFGAAALTARFAAGRVARVARVVGAVIAVAVAASFAFAVVTSRSDSPEYYFHTLGRAWEFGLGTLLAVAVATLSARVPAALRAPRARIVLAWLGLVLIAAAIATFDADTPHPGLPTLVPVVGTMLVIAAGTVAGRGSPERLYSARAVRALGDASYSVYLWHWPVLVLLPYVVGRALSGPALALALPLVAVLAAASYRLVERPVIESRAAWLKRPSRVFAALAAGMVLACAIPVATNAWRAHEVAEFEAHAAEAAADLDSCFGAAGAADPSRCSEGASDSLVPNPAFAADDVAQILLDDPDCYMDKTERGFSACEYVGGTGEVGDVLLIGDSHARQLTPLALELADRYDWTLHIATRASCPFSAADRVHDTSLIPERCAEWNEEAAAYAASRSWTLVITSQIQGREFQQGAFDSGEAAAVQGLVDQWAPLVESGARILAFRDSPATRTDILECLELTWEDDALACAQTREEALTEDYQVAAASQFSTDEVRVVDLTDLYCDDALCLPAVHGAEVYQDNVGHLTATWVRSLVPVVVDRVGEDFLAGSSR